MKVATEEDERSSDPHEHTSSKHGQWNRQSPGSTVSTSQKIQIRVCGTEIYLENNISSQKLSLNSAEPWTRSAILPGMAEIESSCGEWAECHKAERFTKALITQPKWWTLHQHNLEWSKHFIFFNTNKQSSKQGRELNLINIATENGSREETNDTHVTNLLRSFHNPCGSQSKTCVRGSKHTWLAAPSQTKNQQLILEKTRSRSSFNLI